MESSNHRPDLQCWNWCHYWSHRHATRACRLSCRRYCRQRLSRFHQDALSNDVDRYILRWFRNRHPPSLQSQRRHYRRHPPRLDHLLAKTNTCHIFLLHTCWYDNFDFFKKVVTFHGIRNTLAVQDWNLTDVSGQFGLAFFTFLYVDILDCTGTLYSMARFAGAIDEETQDFEGSAVAYLVDGTHLSTLFIPPPLTHYSIGNLNRFPLRPFPSNSLY